MKPGGVLNVTDSHCRGKPDTHKGIDEERENRDAKCNERPLGKHTFLALDGLASLLLKLLRVLFGVLYALLGVRWHKPPHDVDFLLPPLSPFLFSSFSFLNCLRCQLSVE